MNTPPRAPGDRFWPLFRNAARLRCPVCKRGRIFPGWMRMADLCPECEVQIKREAGYFLGSIYFNYGVTCVLAGITYFGLLFGVKTAPGIALATALFVTIAFPFWFWRYARSLWLLLDQWVDPRRPPTSGASP